MAEDTVFNAPELSVRQICSALNGKYPNLNIDQKDFTPTKDSLNAERWLEIWHEILLFFDLNIYQDTTLETQKQIHSRQVHYQNLYAVLNPFFKQLCNMQVEFSMMDTFSPQKERHILFLSNLINFNRFYDRYLQPAFQEFEQTEAQAADTLDDVERQTEDVRGRLQEAQWKREADEPEIQKLTEQKEELNAQCRQLLTDTDNMKGQIDQLNLQIAEANKALANAKEVRVGLKSTVDELEKQLVRSPERLEEDRLRLETQLQHGQERNALLLTQYVEQNQLQEQRKNCLDELDIISELMLGIEDSVEAETSLQDEIRRTKKSIDLKTVANNKEAAKLDSAQRQLEVLRAEAAQRQLELTNRRERQAAELQQRRREKEGLEQKLQRQDEARSRQLEAAEQQRAEANKLHQAQMDQLTDYKKHMLQSLSSYNAVLKNSTQKLLTHVKEELCYGYELIFKSSPADVVSGDLNFFLNFHNPYSSKYGYFSESSRIEMLQEAKKMFYFGYDNYMKYAFPQDELDPIHCSGRGPDYDNPSNININDVLGDYALTLVDSLDTLVLMGNVSEFRRAAQLVIEHVSFDKSNTVQVFEATIRVLGGLLSAHLLVKSREQPFGELAWPGYEDELLTMAHDLATRLLPAFEDTATGIPYPRVNLRTGVPADCVNVTCTSGAGTLLLEFGVLGRLLQDPVYEGVARRALDRLWRLRSNVTGLFGNVVDIQTGEWVGVMSGLGAGIDSFYEYLLKSYILFGNRQDLQRFNSAYETIKFYLRRGRQHCNRGVGFPPIYVNVHMKNGEVYNNWIDSLQAAWPGVQVLAGDIDEAICSHAWYYSLWKRYGCIPERYNWWLKKPEVLFYPLRPELVESTYLLYRATKNPFYLHVGAEIIRSLNNYTKVKCGYATVHNVDMKSLEDRMESFFLSETVKYLILLFDTDNPVNREAHKYLFTTEGHVLPLDTVWHRSSWQDMGQSESGKDPPDPRPWQEPEVVVDTRTANVTNDCARPPAHTRHSLPLGARYLQQLDALVGVEDLT